MVKADVAIRTKIRSRYGNFLSAEDFKRISGCSQLSQFVSQIRTVPTYAPAFEGIHEGLDRRGNIELLLKKAKYINFADICRFDEAISDSLYNLVLLYVETELVSSLFLSSATNTKSLFPLILPEYFLKKINFDFSVSSFENEKVVSDDLKNMRIYPAISNINFDEINQSEHYSFVSRLESVLNKYLFSEIEKATEKYNKKTVADIKEFLGIVIDVKNLKALWRCKKYYSGDVEQIISFMLPGGRYLTESRLKNMVDMSDGEMVESLQKTPFYEAMKTADISERIDSVLDTVLLKTAKKHMVYGTDAPTAFLAFVVLLEIEQNDLTSITECIRYNIPPEKRSYYLTGNQ